MKKFCSLVLSVVMLTVSMFNILPVAAAHEYGVAGDVNGNSTVETADYMLVKQVLKGGTVTDAVKANADVNHDTKITSVDYILVKHIVVGIPVQVLPEPLPAQPAITDNSGSFTVKVNGTFSNNMVIQRNRYIDVFGTASKAGGYVYVKLGDEVRYAKVDSSKNWKVTLNGRPANTTPQTMKIYTKAQGENGGIKLNNILIGDVWIISGQSNAQISLNTTLVNNSSFESKISESDNIRLFTQWFWDCSDYWGNFTASGGKYQPITRTPQVNPPSNASWLVGNATNAKGFSAVGFYFAKRVADNTDVPLGIIQCVAGGSALCDFMPPDQYVASKHNKGESQFYASDIYNSLIHPFSQTEITGMIFYQGEGNQSVHSSYAENLTDFVGMMRNIYGKNMPFYNVQLPSHNTGSNWPGLADVRFEQYDALSTISNYYLATTMDKPISNHDTDWAHPTNKKFIGDRLGYLALANIYAYKSYPMSSYGTPQLTRVEVSGGYAYLYFKNFGTGLVASNDGSVRGFTNYANGAALTATLEGNNCVKVKVTSGLKTIAYGDSALATMTTHNLKNSKGIYAPAFRYTL